jgi:hypothetical protein
MDYSFDRLLEPLIAAVFFGMMGFGLIVLARTLAKDLRRRHRVRELAVAEGWRFLGHVPSDGRDPYTRFEQVSWAGLLRNVVEGRARGFDFSAFEYCATPRNWNTGVLVQLDVAPVSCRVEFSRSGVSSTVHGLDEAATKIGPRTAAALRKAGELLDAHSMAGLVVEIGSGAVLMRAVRSPLKARETPALLEAAFALSAAVVDDERSSSSARHS